MATTDSTVRSLNMMSPTATTERAPYTFGLDVHELIDQLTRQHDTLRSAIHQADSLTTVAGLALRAMDCDADADIADVLQEHVYPELEKANEALGAAVGLLARLRDLGEQP